jgi:hypothetical protein
LSATLSIAGVRVGAQVLADLGDAVAGAVDFAVDAVIHDGSSRVCLSELPIPQ